MPEIQSLLKNYPIFEMLKRKFEFGNEERFEWIRTNCFSSRELKDLMNYRGSAIITTGSNGDR